MNIYRSFGVYTFSGFLAKGVAFLLLPFFTNYLSPSDYGIITIFSNAIYFIAPVMNMGIGETFTVEYSTLNKNDLKSFVGSSFIVPFIVTSIAVLTVFFFHAEFTVITGLTETLLYLVCLLCLFNFFYNYLFTILRSKNKPYAYGLLAVLSTITELVLAIYFIKYCKAGYIGRIESILISTSLVALAAIIYIIKEKMVVLTIDTKWIWLILKRGFPAIPMSLMIFILNNADKFMINYYYGPSKAGIYGLASQFAMILFIFISAFITPFYPYMYDSLNKDEYKKVVILAIKYVSLLLGVVIIMPFAVEIVFKYFINNKFQLSLYYLFPLLLGQFFFGLYLLLAGLVYYKRHNHIYYYISPIVIALTIFFNYLFLNIFKINQLAYAPLIANFCCFIILATHYRHYIKLGIVLLLKSKKI